MAKTLAYQVTVRRIATGCDYHIRLFSHSADHACDRAKDRARFAERISLAKYRELNAKGIACFRVISCEVSADQSRPNA
ncbi:hypothetical protein [Bradyrhizobium erythrophlei]|uniref:Uncharacterized protein n=1 Tax=Bradyrhizobium erythrophlei TaxID=1437360 RepID=A0A1H4NTI9_9BRAD|nr:hypothetical protein [Bradyrhizobium erythrophlei]SEB98563.1 hypothetical protein SAMN05444164_0727 [Bradyrhizobium erythrophlei]